MLAARAAVAGAEEGSGRPWGYRDPRPARHRAARRRPSGVTRLAVLFGVIGALLLLYVAEQAFVISLSYRLNGVKAALHAAAVQTDRLQLRISELSSPERIERVAREELHLVAPGEPAYLTETVQVAMVRPAEEDEPGFPVIARIQRLLRGSLVQAAHAAE
ncbi:MAG: septum formation initiator family protein [Bacillota bacterium]|nr:septum formation initiator family protein [Bacillota bacterium]